MPYIPHDFLDNTAGRTLGDALVRLIAEWEQTEMDAATGFFEPHVWHHLGEAFPRLERLRLLLGRPPEVLPQGKVQALDLRRYFRRKLQGDLETLPYNADYVALVDALLAFLRREGVAVRLYCLSSNPCVLASWPFGVTFLPWTCLPRTVSSLPGIASTQRRKEAMAQGSWTVSSWDDTKSVSQAGSLQGGVHAPHL